MSTPQPAPRDNVPPITESLDSLYICIEDQEDPTIRPGQLPPRATCLPNAEELSDPAKPLSIYICFDDYDPPHRLPPS